MDARSTTQELSRLADLPALDDAQLDFMVDALDSSDSWIDQEDGGYGSQYSAQYEIKVSDCAEQAIGRLGAPMLPRLVQRLRSARGQLFDGLLKALSRVDAKRWATLTPDQRTDTRNVIALHGPFTTLGVAEDLLTTTRARELVGLRLLALDAVETGPVLQALESPSLEVRKVAEELAPFLRESSLFAERALDAFLRSDDFMKTWGLAKALHSLEVPRDDAQRARLVAVLDDDKLGDEARGLLTRGLSRAEADERYPYSARRIARAASSLVTDTNEGSWRAAISRFGRATIGEALIPVLRDALVNRTVSDEILHHMALVGPSLAPLAEPLLPYLTPATSPSWRHVRWAIAVAEAIKSPLLVPALEALLKTDHEPRAREALSAIAR